MFADGTGARAFIPFASAVANHEGRQRVDALNRSRPLRDPAFIIGEELADKLAERFNLTIYERNSRVTNAESPAELIRAHKGVDLILDVRSVRLWAQPTGGGRFSLTYHSTLLLVDARSNDVLASDSCQANPVSLWEQTKYDDLVANDAALLKQEVAGLAEYCSEDFRKRVLGLY